MQEASTVGDVARIIPRINASLEDHREYYQPTMIELEGKLLSQSISILVDLGAILSYVNPKIIEVCKLKGQKFKNPWMVQLTTGGKRKVSAKIPNYALEIADQ